MGKTYSVTRTFTDATGKQRQPGEKYVPKDDADAKAQVSQGNVKEEAE